MAQLDRAGDVPVEAGADELRQAGGTDEAAADARGEGAAGRRQHRDAHPERVRRRRVRAIGRRVEKKVGEADAGEMPGVRLLRREDEPFGRDAVSGGVPAERRLGSGAAGEEPQHGILDAPENLHPAREGEAADLLRAVEGAIDERVFREACLGA